MKDWFIAENRKPLIIRGARQVGKSSIVRIFSKNNHLELLEINFERNPNYADFFQLKDPEKIIKLLEINFEVEITQNTLIFLDEIQAQPQVLSTLRYFYEEKAEIPVIAAGSLLDFELNSPEFSMPVGRVSYIHLHPMGFYEFLMATGKNKLSEFLCSYKFGQEIPKVLHQKLISEFKTFITVGGMPEAVKVYTKTQSLKQTETIKRDLLATFVNDFAKYSKQHQYQLIRKVFAQISRNIGRKIKYTNLSADNKSADVSAVIDLLDSARVIKKVIRSSANGLPLAAEANEKFFKVIFLDVGLISTQLNLSAEALNADDILLVNRGELAEQWVGQALLLNIEDNQHPELHYWAREKKSSSAEIDYVIPNKSNVLPIEVKAGKTGTLKSLHLFIKEKQSQLAIRFNSEPPSYYEDDKILSLPIYLAERVSGVVEG
ncbi:Predicted ATPase (AAA+ superfamily) [hydrothermal vent metagenome]|uniref:Predicted ATPase (AAA+ superfamily) n=1 Tax=hydrothermal vent metagenome TaxID=652676 RepID=A0A3B0W0H2_9ZZZZ